MKKNTWMHLTQKIIDLGLENDGSGRKLLELIIKQALAKKTFPDYLVEIKKICDFECDNLEHLIDFISLFPQEHADHLGLALLSVFNNIEHLKKLLDASHNNKDKILGYLTTVMIQDVQQHALLIDALKTLIKSTENEDEISKIVIFCKHLKNNSFIEKLLNELEPREISCLITLHLPLEETKSFIRGENFLTKLLSEICKISHTKKFKAKVENYISSLKELVNSRNSDYLNKIPKLNKTFIDWLGEVDVQEDFDPNILGICQSIRKELERRKDRSSILLGSSSSSQSQPSESSKNLNAENLTYEKILTYISGFIFLKSINPYLISFLYSGPHLSEEEETFNQSLKSFAIMIQRLASNSEKYNLSLKEDKTKLISNEEDKEIREKIKYFLTAISKENKNSNNHTTQITLKEKDKICNDKSHTDILETEEDDSKNYKKLAEVLISSYSLFFQDQHQSLSKKDQKKTNIFCLFSRSSDHQNIPINIDFQNKPIENFDLFLKSFLKKGYLNLKYHDKKQLLNELKEISRLEKEKLLQLIPDIKEEERYQDSSDITSGCSSSLKKDSKESSLHDSLSLSADFSTKEDDNENKEKLSLDFFNDYKRYFVKICLLKFEIESLDKKWGNQENSLKISSHHLKNKR